MVNHKGSPSGDRYATCQNKVLSSVHTATQTVVETYARLIEVGAELLHLQAIRDEYIPFLCLQRRERLEDALPELPAV